MITSTANPKIKQVVQWQTKSKERSRSKVFLVEGFKMFEEAPEESILEVYLSEAAIEKAKGNTSIWKKLNDNNFEVVSGQVFQKMSDTKTPQGILTVLRQPNYKMEDLLQAPNPLLVILEDLQDPGNLGTIIRTGEGAGVTGVIMTKQTVDIFNPKTIRSTMGSIYRVPFLYIEEIETVIQKLHDNQINTYAAHLQGETYYDSFTFSQPTAFLIGNEGSGLQKSTADLAKHYLKIPMEGQVESLNAAIATSLLMYETHRQRSVRDQML